MSRRIHGATAAVLAWAGVVLIAGQQDQTPPPPVFRTGVETVRVDVSVTGREDEPIADLQAADFEVLEDGVPQEVQTVQFVRRTGVRTSDTTDALEIRSAEHAAAEAAREDVRVFAIFLDDYHVDKDQLITLRVRKALGDFVRQFGPNDIVAVMDPLTPLTHLRYTRSRDLLLMRMNQFEGRRGQMYPVRSAIEEAQLMSPRVWQLRGEVTLSALEALVTALGGLGEGRKSVLFVSQGPIVDRMDATYELRLRAILQAAGRGNVTINVFDPRPLGAAPLGGTDVMARLASETGGRAVVNANDPAERLAQTLADASAYYLIGYTPARSDTDGKFRRIEVKVKRRGVRVQARRGYWSADRPPMLRLVAVPPRPEAAPVIAPPEPRADQSIHFWVGTSRATTGLTTVLMTWEPIARLSAAKARRVLVEPLDPATLPQGSDARAVAPAADLELGRAASFDVPPRTPVALRVTVRTDDGAIVDRWAHPVDVPAFDEELGCGTPRFLRARSAFEARSWQQGGDVTPAAAHRFHRTDRVTLEAPCHASGSIAPAMTAHLVNGRGAALAQLEAAAHANGAIRITLPMTSLAPGLYAVKLHASLGGRATSQTVGFHVIP